MKIDIDINSNYEETTLVIKAPELTDAITELISGLKDQKPKSISGKIGQKIYVLNPSEIALFYSENGKVLAKNNDNSYELKQKLYEIEEMFNDSTFVRISKSAIVNIKHIKNIEVFFNGSLVVKFHNGHEEIISRRYVKQVKDFIGMGGNV